MSYEVLARKLRPSGFSALVGQDHVVRALTHALDHDPKKLEKTSLDVLIGIICILLH